MARRSGETLRTLTRPLEPDDREGVAQRVVNRILDMVRTGNLRAGDRLPSERELIEILGISRPSLREALRALSMLGVIESRHGGGAFVSSLEPRALLAPLDFFLSLSPANLADSFESRRVIEVEIVRRAAGRASSADIADLHDMLAAHETVADDPVGFRCTVSPETVRGRRQCRARTDSPRALQYGPRHQATCNRGPGPDPREHPRSCGNRRGDRRA